MRTQDPELRNIKDAVNKLKRTLLLTITGFCLILLSLILSSLEIEFITSTVQPFFVIIFAVGGIIVLLRGLFGSDDNL